MAKSPERRFPPPWTVEEQPALSSNDDLADGLPQTKIIAALDRR
jgi:hypothetical protein